MDEKMKKVLQKIADWIVERGYKAPTKADVKLWFDIGMAFNRWCVKRNIYLD